MKIDKTLKHENTCVIAMIMPYDNRKSLISKVLGVVVYCFLENMFVLTICVYKNNRNGLCHTEGLKTLHLISCQ